MSHVEEALSVFSSLAAADPAERFEPAVDQTVREFLHSITISDLRDIARRRDFALSGTRKDDIVDQLVAALRESTGDADFLAGLTEEEREGLRILHTLYGVRDFITLDEIQWAWERHDQLKVSPSAINRVLNGLEQYGLLFRCQDASHHTEEHFHWLPYLLGAHLPVVKPAAETYPKPKVSQLKQPEAAPPVPAAVASLVAFAEHHELRLREKRQRHQRAQYFPILGEWDHDPDEIDRLVARGYSQYAISGIPLTVLPFESLLTDDVLEKLARWLDSQPEFASWLTLIGVASGILTPPDATKTPLTVRRDAWAQWYGLPFEQQLHTLFNTWRYYSGSFTELSLAQKREPNLKVQRTASYYHQFSPTDMALEFAFARGFVTRLLQGLPAEVWYDWFSFAEIARNLDSYFLHNYYGPEVWGFAYKDDERLDPSRRADWDRGYRPVLAAFLEGPLRWLGVVDVGYKGPHLVAFRVTQTGAWLLRGEGRPALPQDIEQAPATWLDDRRFRLRPGPEGARVLALAEGTLAAPTREAFVYELSSEGVQAAFSEGIEPDVIAEAFAQAGAPMPDATRQRIDDLWSRFGHVHLYEKLTVLELADDLALRELLANTKLRQHIVHQFSPRLVVVADSAVDELVGELVEKGYTPKVSGQ